MQITYRDELLTASSTLEEDYALNSQEFAEKSLQAFAIYRSRFPNLLYDGVYSDAPIDANNMQHWLHNLAMPPKQVHMNTNLFSKANFPENPSTIGRAALVQKRADAAMRYILWARERLDAFLKGNEDLYRQARECAMNACALCEKLTLLVEIDDYLV
jgi:hypothetical protein